MFSFISTLRQGTNNHNHNNRNNNNRRNNNNFFFFNGYTRDNFTNPNTTTTNHVSAERAENSNTILTSTFQPPPPTRVTSPILPTIRFQSTYSNTSIDVNANIQDENYSHPYYSTFTYNDLDIRYFHNNILNETNTQEIIDTLLQNINNAEIDQLINNIQEYNTENFIDNTLNDAPTNSENDNETIKKILDNIIETTYLEHKHIIKNHTCPILLNDFIDDDIIAVFKLCNHAIDESVKIKFVKTFTKCPLCNLNIF